MMCQRIGWAPISTMGLGRYSVSSRRRVPCPPQRITTGRSRIEGLVIAADSWVGRERRSFYRTPGMPAPGSVLDASDVAERLQLLDLLAVALGVAMGEGEARAWAHPAMGRHRA